MGNINNSYPEVDFIPTVPVPTMVLCERLKGVQGSKWEKIDQSFVYDLERWCYDCFGIVGGRNKIRECRCDWRKNCNYKNYV